MSWYVAVSGTSQKREGDGMSPRQCVAYPPSETICERLLNAVYQVAETLIAYINELSAASTEGILRGERRRGPEPTPRDGKPVFSGWCRGLSW